jgi:flavin reductase (DIM6/NTAB) family NADH-FMN oxidoreductase RutF
LSIGRSANPAGPSRRLTSFTSVSLDPPLVSFSIANASQTWPALRRAEHLGVTVLAVHHGAVCRQLAGPAQHRFDGVPVTATRTGAVALDDGLARFDCSIYREIEAGDHTIVLLFLHAVEHTDSSPPLVFHRSRFELLSPAALTAHVTGGQYSTLSTCSIDSVGCRTWTR